MEAAAFEVKTGGASAVEDRPVVRPVRVEGNQSPDDQRRDHVGATAVKSRCGALHAGSCDKRVVDQQNVPTDSIRSWGKRRHRPRIASQ